MAKRIRERQQIVEISYQRSFENRDGMGGFGFDCEEDGTIIPKESSAENLAKCLDGTYDVIDRGIERREHRYTLPAAIRCDCGGEVDLYGFTNTCDCGRDYNSCGDLLASRSQWGEETGEHISDILRIR